MRHSTRWIFFLLATLANMALVYAFLPQKRQVPALAFVAATCLVTGMYMARVKRAALRTLKTVAAQTEMPGWGKAATFETEPREKTGEAETITYAVWRAGGASVWLQRRLPRNGLGMPETLVSATFSSKIPCKLMVYRRSLSSDIESMVRMRSVSPAKAQGAPLPFVTKADPPEAAARFLDAGTWEVIHALAGLEDPLHQFVVSLREQTLAVSLEGDLYDEASVTKFLEMSFRLIARASGILLGGAR